MSYKTYLEGTPGSSKPPKKKVIKATENAVYFSAPFVDESFRREQIAATFARTGPAMVYRRNEAGSQGGIYHVPERGFGVSNLVADYAGVRTRSGRVLGQHGGTNKQLSQQLAEESTPGMIENAMNSLYNFGAGILSYLPEPPFADVERQHKTMLEERGLDQPIGPKTIPVSYESAPLKKVKRDQAVPDLSQFEVMGGKKK